MRRLTARDMALAALASIIWGLAFVTIKFGLDDFSAPQLTVLRFVIGAVPVFFVARPPPLICLARCDRTHSVRGPIPAAVLCLQRRITGRARFGEPADAGIFSRCCWRQFFCTTCRASGKRGNVDWVRRAGAYCAHLESEFPPLAFGPALAGASSWAVGNVMVKRRTDIPIFPLVVWCSLVPPLPALAVSLAVDPVPD